MRNNAIVKVFLVLFLFLWPSLSKAEPYHRDGRYLLILERIVDGDTIVASGKKVRLWGIDAPEAAQEDGKTATMALKALVKVGSELDCKFIEKDRYNRDVMQCLSDGLDIGSMLVSIGAARDYERYSGGYYQFEQEKAKKAQRGIWATKL